MSSSEAPSSTAKTLICPVCKSVHERGRECGLLVYVSSTCPICLEEKSPVVALPCGHTLCQDDFDTFLRSCPPASNVEQRQGDNDNDGAESNDSSDDSSDGISGMERAITIFDRGDESSSYDSSFDEDDIIVTHGDSSSSDDSPNWHIHVCNDTDSSSVDDSEWMNHSGIMSEVGSSDDDEGSSAGAMWFERDDMDASSNDEEDSDEESLVSVCSIANTASSDRDDPSLRDYTQNDSPGTFGAWILCGSGSGSGSVYKELWYDDSCGNKKMYNYANECRLHNDGVGGAWVFSGTVLYHVNGTREHAVSPFPSNSRFVSDGKGGIWALCPEDGEVNYILKHVKINRQLELYQYPKTSRMYADGNGGVFVSCNVSGVLKVWHANLIKEQNIIQCPPNSRITGDGNGGMWILPNSDVLFHVDSRGRRRQMGKYRASSRLIPDTQGGVWIHGAKDNKWKIWSVRQNSEREVCDCPRTAKVAPDYKGGMWILRKDPGGKRTLCHAIGELCHEVRVGYPPDSNLAF